MKVQLTNRERKTIKKAVKIQLESLRGILSGDCGEDIELFCLQERIDKAKLNKLVLRNIKDFERVYAFPESFLNLPETHLSTLKHVLETCVKTAPRVKAGLWSKFVVFEQLSFNPN
jgi:hypothetical protein